MTPELGHFALVLAFCLAGVQAFLGIAGPERGNVSWMHATRAAAVGQWVFTATAFLVLAWSFVQMDFSVRYVATNSNSQLPLIYRIAAVWGAHEGSLLLWAMILSCWTLAVAALSGSLPLPFRTRVLGILGIVSFGFLMFMLTTSSPFERLVPAAVDGRDLNPLLQDPALALHPPGLYVGYVGFSVAFAFACAALLEGRLDSAWAKWTRPWTLTAWLFLTVGIVLGSWWAYYELGWGGWWFWDPVENASFMPWLAGAALIHSLAVTEKRGLFKAWTMLLAVFTFSLSLLGTFLVRSGVLVSVHAFASDPARGLFILGFLVVIVGGALALFAWRAPLLKSEAGFELASRESFILINNALLLVATALILVGTLYPLFMDTLNLGKISVGPPYFATAFVIPMLPLIVLLGIGMHAAWKRSRLESVKVRLIALGVIAVVAAILIELVAYEGFKALTAVGIAAALFIMASSLLEPYERWRRKAPMTGAVIGMVLAHFGVGVFTLGVTGVESYKIEKDVSLGPGDGVTLAGYDFRMTGTKEVSGPNYDAIQATFEITRGGEPIATLKPQKRFYRSGGNPMTEAGIDAHVNRDLFVALGEDIGGGKWSVRVQYKPLIRLVWLGGLLMAIGGLFAAADRRYRVPSRSAATEPAGAAAREGAL